MPCPEDSNVVSASDGGGGRQTGAMVGVESTIDRATRAIPDEEICMPGNTTIVFEGENEVATTDRDRPKVGVDEVLIETSQSLISTGTKTTLRYSDYN